MYYTRFAITLSRTIFHLFENIFKFTPYIAENRVMTERTNRKLEKILLGNLPITREEKYSKFTTADLDELMADWRALPGVKRDETLTALARFICAFG